MLGQPATQPRAERRTIRRRVALFLPDLPVGGGAAAERDLAIVRTVTDTEASR